MNIRELDLKFDISLLQKDVERLLMDCPFHPEANQISLTHRPEALVPFYDGTGSLFNHSKNEWYAREEEFTEFNVQLKDWYLHFVYKEVLKDVGPMGRVRLMRLRPKTCLSMHRDSSCRIHVPIFTNPQSFFVFQEFPALHLPADGRVHWLNTVIPHSAMNGHTEIDRIHLVFTLLEEKESGSL